MSQIKKILLYLIGVGLLIFGNRDVLAKISTKKIEPAEKELKPDSKAFSKPKDSVRREAIKVVEKKNNALLDSIHAATTPKAPLKAKMKELVKAEPKKEKAEVVVAGVEKEAEKVEEAPKTKVEKEEPEKAHGTE